MAFCACADPGNWQVPPYVAADFANTFLYKRAQIAHAQNKPWILEETGKDVRGLPLLCTDLHIKPASCARPVNSLPNVFCWCSLCAGPKDDGHLQLGANKPEMVSSVQLLSDSTTLPG